MGKKVLAAAFAAGFLTGFAAEQVVCRVEDHGGGPQIYVDGMVCKPHWIWTRDTTRKLSLSSEWKSFDLAVTPAQDAKGAGVWIRIEHKPGLVEARNCRLVGSDGTDRVLDGWSVAQPAHRSFCKGGKGTFRLDFRMPTGANPFDKASFDMYSRRMDVKKGVTYRILMDVRAEGIGFFRPALQAADDSRYWAWLEEMPFDDPALLASCEQIRMAGTNGVVFVTFHTPSCWTEQEEDFSPVDATFRRILRANPKALLVPRIGLIPPSWWLKRHPEARMGFHDGTFARSQYASISSEVFRREAFAHVERMIRHLMKEFPRSFAGVHLAGQNTGEWFYAESYNKMSGYDESMLKAWRSWLKDRGDPGWETALVPPVEARERTNGLKRLMDVADPVQARNVEFSRFQQAEMASFVNEGNALCRRVTEGKKLVVSFYGYTWEFVRMHWGPANTGHYGVMKLIREGAENLDIISAPLSYDADRRFCGSTPVMHAADTFLRHGILPVYEDDSRTHLDERVGAAFSEGSLMNERETREMLARNLGVQAVRGFGSWWMDLYGHGWFQDEHLWDLLPEIREADEAALNRSRMYAPPVALIVDEESMLRTGVRDANVSGPLFKSSRRAFPRSGASYGQYLLEDVVERPLEARLQVHLATWAPTAETAARLAADRAKRPDLTRVWCWKPGLLTDCGSDLKAVERLTGFCVRFAATTSTVATVTVTGRSAGLPERIEVTKDFYANAVGQPCEELLAVETTPDDIVWATWEDGSAAVVLRRNPGGSGWSVFYGPTFIPWQAAATLVKAAGIHSYLSCPDGNAALYATDDLVVFQQHEKGRREIVFPEKVEILDVRANARLPKARSFAFDLEKGDVKILRVKKSAK